MCLSRDVTGGRILRTSLRPGTRALQPELAMLLGRKWRQKVTPPAIPTSTIITIVPAELDLESSLSSDCLYRGPFPLTFTVRRVG